MTGAEIFARAEPYLPAFRSVVPDLSPLSWVVGVFDRESNCGGTLRLRVPGTLVGWGDRDKFGRYHAFGGCQKDTGNGGELVIRGFIPGIDLLTPEGQARFVYLHVMSSLDIIGRAFPAMPEPARIEAALCAYNADIGLVLGTIEADHDPNSVTTGHDYGRDVVTRAGLVLPFLISAAPAA